MNSTKRYLPVLAVVCVLFLTASGNAQNATQEFTSQFGPFGSPCDGSIIEVHGPATIDYHMNLTGVGPHVTIHMQTQASSSELSANPYQTNFEANGQFDSGTVCTNDPGTLCYDTPFHSVWIGNGGAPNFKADGTIRVFVTNGTLAGSAIVAGEPPIPDPVLSCTN